MSDNRVPMGPPTIKRDYDCEMLRRKFLLADGSVTDMAARKMAQIAYQYFMETNEVTD